MNVKVLQNIYIYNIYGVYYTQDYLFTGRPEFKNISTEISWVFTHEAKNQGVC